MKLNIRRSIAAILCSVLMLAGWALPDARATSGHIKSQWCRCSELQEAISEASDRMDAAHSMAQSARALGIEENDTIIQTAKQIWNSANTKKATAAQQLKTMECGTHDYHYDLFRPTNLSVAAFDYLLKGSKLEGCGEYFQELENTYGVNGLFAMAVAKVESGLGRSKLAVNKNNYYGMIGNSFATPQEGVLAFGKLMNKPLYHDKSLEAIARTYCPPTYKQWASSVVAIMGQYWGKLA